MRNEPDDDLAAALPPSLTVDLQLPEPMHEAPPEEAIVALDEVAVSPVPEAEVPATHSLPVVTPAVVIPDPEPHTPASDVVPLPEAPARPPVRAPRARRPEPVRPGRKPAPEGALQGLVYALTLHLVNLGDSQRARARKALDARIARPLGKTRFIPVLSRKGGVGKTTITALLGLALADARDDGVLAVDGNPDRGTLADRVPRSTRSSVRDVVLRSHELKTRERFEEHVSTDPTGLDVLASDEDPLLAEAFGEGDYHVLADTAARHYGVVLTDSGTGVVHPVVRATLRRADVVVIVSGGSIDEARLASETLTWLEANGYRDLVANAVVALNAATQGTDLARLDEIEDHFLSRVRAVVRIPYDAELAAGSVIRYSELQPFTRESARDLAGLVVDGIQAPASQQATRVEAGTGVDDREPEIAS